MALLILLLLAPSGAVYQPVREILLADSFETCREAAPDLAKRLVDAAPRGSTITWRCIELKPAGLGSDRQRMDAF